VIGERIQGALAGRGATVVVEGRAGLGKTRLLAEAAAIARGVGLTVGAGVVAARDQAVPMGALLSALFEGRAPVVDPAAWSALHYVPEQRYLLLDDLETLLEQAALRSPLLLCLDDMQWADGACLTALRTLPVRLSSLPIVWLVAHRATQSSPELRAVIQSLEDTGADRVTLAPLRDEAVAQVVTDVLGAAPDSDLAEMVQRSHGSPFLLVELLHGWREEGLVRVDGDRAGLRETRLPARVRDTMRDRLAGMSDLARRGALVASVLGRRFSFDQLSMMLHVPPSVLLGPIDELVVAELLAEDDGLLVFRHDLIREAVRDTLPGSARRSLQRQAVDVLLAAGALPVEVAVQLAASADADDAPAVRTLREASRALAGSDPSRAADLSMRALDLAGKDDPLRGTLAAETALLLHAAGRVTEGKEFADRILGEVLAPEQEGEVRLSIARMLALSADVRAEAGLRALALSGLPAPLRARHLATLVHNRLVGGRYDDARALVREARQAVDATGDANATFALDLAEAGLVSVTGDLGRALEMTEAASRNRRRAGEPARQLLAEEWRTELLAALDRYEQSLQLTADGLMAAQRSQQWWGVRLWDGWRGRQLLHLGRLPDAAAALESADPGDEVHLMSVHDVAALVAFGRVAIHRGDEPSRRHGAARAAALLDVGSPAVRRHAAWLLALEASADGDHREAHRRLTALGEEERLSVLPRLPLDVTDEVELVRIGTAVGDDQLVDAAVRSARIRAECNPGVRSIAGTSAHVEGLARGECRAMTEAIEHFEQGPRPLALASALEDLGRMLVGHGDRDGGIARLGRALEVYAHAGASRDAGRVRGHLRSLGVRRRLVAAPPSPDGWSGLTESELAVVRLVVEGLTNREVAERLFLSPHTVSTHLRHAFEKLRLNSRVELTRLASRQDVGAH
jgi:DNA-binding CsgD family transcriptional regulator